MDKWSSLTADGSILFTEWTMDKWYPLSSHVIVGNACICSDNQIKWNESPKYKKKISQQITPLAASKQFCLPSSVFSLLSFFFIILDGENLYGYKMIKI